MTFLMMRTGTNKWRMVIDSDTLEPDSWISQVMSGDRGAIYYAANEDHGYNRDQKQPYKIPTESSLYVVEFINDQYIEDSIEITLKKRISITTHIHMPTNGGS